MQTKKFFFVLSVTFVLASVLGACAQQTETPTTLRIVVLPILDALPMYVAQQEGYFEENGVSIQFIPASSAAERDQIIAAGQGDGMINDLISTLFYNQDEIQIQIVRFARTATPEFAQFSILAAPNSGIADVGDLRKVEIGISEGSVIEYTTDRLLEAEGISTDDIVTIAVPKIPDRLSLLTSGELLAANLPDPLSLLAMQSGATVIVDDTKHPEYGNSEISFRKEVVEQHPEAIRGFLAAIEKAVIEINANPTKWDNLLSEKQLVPAPLIGTYQIPIFPAASVPSNAQWEDAIAWAIEKAYLTNDVSYSDSVNNEFLP
jgi:NitT/TauT family transport system substrate-binding protein